MSLFDCPACGETVPDASVSCPRCGHRFKHEKVFSLSDPFSVIGVVVITLAVLAMVTFLVGGLLWR